MGSNLVKQYQRYPEEYFSSANVRIFIGDEIVDEIAALSFTLIEEVLPIRGYASRTYDVVARGSRTINGQIAINFKGNDYLYKIMNNYIAKRLGITNQSKDTLTGESSYMPMGTESSIDEILSKSYGHEEFKKISEEYKKKYWGEENNDSLSSKHDDEPYFFGSELGKNSIELIQELRNKGFTIEIQYNNSYANNIAIRKIYGVQLTGFGQQIKIEGQPIREQYTFLAKDISR